MNLDKKSAIWSQIEAEIRIANPAERDLEWGRLRQDFYEKFGELELSFGDKERLTSLKGSYKGNRIFIIGNGPSLKKTTLNLIN